MTRGVEWTDTITADLETIQRRLAERRDQHTGQLEDSIERVRTDLEEARSVIQEKERLEQQLRSRCRRRSNRQQGTETWQRLDREIRDLQQEAWKMERWFADARREITRELEEVQHALEDAEFSAEVLEGLDRFVVG